MGREPTSNMQFSIFALRVIFMYMVFVHYKNLKLAKNCKNFFGEFFFVNKNNIRGFGIYVLILLSQKFIANIEVS